MSIAAETAKLEHTDFIHDIDLIITEISHVDGSRGFSAEARRLKTFHRHRQTRVASSFDIVPPLSPFPSFK